MTQKDKIEESNRVIAGEFELPDWYKDCPLSMDWVKWKGEVYFAVLNYEESEKRQHPYFDLAYCATRGMNEIFLKERVRWIPKNFELNPPGFNNGQHTKDREGK